MSKNQADYWQGRPKSRKQPRSRTDPGIIHGADSALESALEQARPRNHPTSRLDIRISLGLPRHQFHDAGRNRHDKGM